MRSPPPNGEATSPITTQDERRDAKCGPEPGLMREPIMPQHDPHALGLVPEQLQLLHTHEPHTREHAPHRWGATRTTHANPLPKGG